MKHIGNGKHDGAMEQVMRAGISSAFQLDGDTYMLIEMSPEHTPCPRYNFPGATDVGHCEMHGKTYTILKLAPALLMPEELVTMLTERELEITMLVALGWPNKQIADHLHISEWTVSTHLRRIFAKLGVHNRAAMVYRCTSLLSVGSNQA